MALVLNFRQLDRGDPSVDPDDYACRSSLRIVVALERVEVTSGAFRKKAPDRRKSDQAGAGGAVGGVHTQTCVGRPSRVGMDISTSSPAPLGASLRLPRHDRVTGSGSGVLPDGSPAAISKVGTLA